jgi:hypothetical protein
MWSYDGDLIGLSASAKGLGGLFWDENIFRGCPARSCEEAARPAHLRAPWRRQLVCVNQSRPSLLSLQGRLASAVTLAVYHLIPLIKTDMMPPPCWSLSYVRSSNNLRCIDQLFVPSGNLAYKNESNSQDLTWMINYLHTSGSTCMIMPGHLITCCYLGCFPGIN